ncbi:MAG: TRAP transporter small permease [Pseudomonadota bacterium]
MKFVLDLVDHGSRLIGHAAAQLNLVAAAVTIYEVFARYVLNAPTAWGFEVALTLAASAWVLSSGYVTVQQRHIAITLLEAYLSAKARWWQSVVNHLFGIAAISILAYSTWAPAKTALSIPERSGTGFNSPEPAILKFLLFIGACLYALQLSVNLIRKLTEDKDV